MNPTLSLIWLSIVEVFGDFALENYAHTGALASLGKGVAGYIGVVYFLIKSLQGSNILYINGMWDGISCLIESLAAIVFLGQRFTDPMQYLGMFMVIGGIMLLKNKN